MMFEKRKCIVAVDDSNTIRTYLKVNLSAQGYEVKVFDNPLHALEKLPDIHPDIIILDINMPEMSGFDLCQRIKEHSALKAIPVLFLSTESDSDNKVRGFAVGAVDYVTKPINIEVLCARIATHIKLANLQKKQKEKTLHLERQVEEKIEELYRSQISTITALAKLAEFRDEDTGSHLDRVEAYCELIARNLDPEEVNVEINEWYIKRIKFASSLHDIGKVAIPDAILLKPGKLTQMEFEIMKGHAKLGAETLAQALESDRDNEFLHMAYDIANAHHEKWDGSGYPQGLSGEEIPLCARIMAVADVYDALRSERCYKKGFTHEVAYNIIDEGSGTHFDPRIVECFLQNSGEFEKIWDRYRE